jgi:hypothetical protein
MFTRAPVADVSHLVGRDVERAILEKLLQSMVRGSGWLVLIGGEAGIGKTSLVQDLVRRAPEQGAAAGIGRFYEGIGHPFGLWQDLLSDPPLFEVLDPAALPQPSGEEPTVRAAYQVMQWAAEMLQPLRAGRTDGLTVGTRKDG